MKKVIYVTGTFDLFHAGHLGLLQRAKALGDFLVVGVNTDEYVASYKPYKPVISHRQRRTIIEELKCVDAVCSRPTTIAFEMFKKYGPGTRVVGKENKKRYTGTPETIALEKLGVKIKYLPRTSEMLGMEGVTFQSLSSTQIKKRIIKRFLEETILSERKLGRSLSTISKSLGTSRETIRQAEQRALYKKRMKKKMRSPKIK